MEFELNILGCGSAKPTTRHQPTSQLLNVRGKYFMIDCGEGVQTQMQKMGLSMLSIGHIFISHNHGDHIFGLPGLIGTMDLLGRTAELHIHGPQQVGELLDFRSQHHGSQHSAPPQTSHSRLSLQGETGLAAHQTRND